MQGQVKQKWGQGKKMSIGQSKYLDQYAYEQRAQYVHCATAL